MHTLIGKKVEWLVPNSHALASGILLAVAYVPIFTQDNDGFPYDDGHWNCLIQHDHGNVSSVILGPKGVNLFVSGTLGSYQLNQIHRLAKG